MKLDEFSDIGFLASGMIGRTLLPLASFVLILLANYLSFIYVPNEEVMGAVQRIFYFHVGSAMATYVMIGILFIGSVFFLATDRSEWDDIAHAAAVVALALCTIVMASGMIWGHSAWNTWWRWEPRLVSFLVLWLIVFAYVMLRKLSQHEERQARYAAVLGVIAAVNVPLVIFSIKLLDHAEQLHPEVVGRQGLADSRFVVALVVANIAMIVFSLWLAWIKLINIRLRREIVALQRRG